MLSQDIRITIEVETPSLALAAGARVIEACYLGQRADGPDHNFS